jgi:hypothetical protein
METASFPVLNLFQDPETSSGLERYSGQQEIAPDCFVPRNDKWIKKQIKYEKRI